MSNTEKFYRLEYKIGVNGAKHFPGQAWNVEEYEWDPLDPSTYTRNITKNYECVISDNNFDVDCRYAQPHIYCSSKFLSFLEATNAKYRAVPFKLLGKTKDKKTGKNVTIGEYYIILLMDGVSLMNISESKFEIMKDLETGIAVPPAPCTSHPVYEKIENFIFRRDIQQPPLYRCTETGWIMANEAFVAACMEAKLTGPTFTKIEDGAQYDPFAFAFK